MSDINIDMSAWADNMDEGIVRDASGSYYAIVVQGDGWRAVGPLKPDAVPATPRACLDLVDSAQSHDAARELGARLFDAVMAGRAVAIA